MSLERQFEEHINNIFDGLLLKNLNHYKHIAVKMENVMTIIGTNHWPFNSEPFSTVTSDKIFPKFIQNYHCILTIQELKVLFPFNDCM